MIRTRIAPSPTGNFHIGTARTALFNFLFAKQNKGKFILRLEDTDLERSSQESEQDILAGLKWLGINYDEGPDIGGPFGPYRQSERRENYQKAVKKLLETGAAYHCYCTKEELERERQERLAKKLPPIYSGRCRNMKPDPNKPAAVRLKATEGVISFKDLIRGEVKQEASLFGDMVIVRSDGSPLYNLTVVVDDAEMEISHVIRGEDHLTNTFKQIIIGRALGYKQPVFAHLPLIVNADRSKMSKRKDPVSVSRDFRDKGYLPEAIVNYLALLGWSPGNNREYLSLAELIHEFDLKKVQKSAAAWNQKKLDDINGHYIRELSDSDLAQKLRPFLPGIGSQKLLELAPLIKTRIERLDQAEEVIGWAAKEKVTPDPAKITPKKGNPNKTKAALSSAIKSLKTADWQHDAIEKELKAVAKDLNLSLGEIFWPIRYSLTAAEFSPGVFDVLLVLGKEESLKRLERAVKLL